MIGWIDQHFDLPQLIAVVIFAAAALAALVLWMVLDVRKRRIARLVALREVTRDWATTWRVNAVSDIKTMESEHDDVGADFIIRIEDTRMVKDIGGGEVMEIRWRKPTRAEVREIVRKYNMAQAHSEIMKEPSLLHKDQELAVLRTVNG